MEILKIKIYSEGGQGIKSMVDRVEREFNEKNYEDFYITSLVKYDSIIKGGVVETNLIISKEKGSNIFFENADLCILLTKNQKNTITSKEEWDIQGFGKNDTGKLTERITEYILSFFNQAP